jgi:hypothetical protein
MYPNPKKKLSGRVEVAAMHIPGLSPDSKHQFHIQHLAFLDDTPLDDIQNTLRQFSPIVVSAPLIEQLSSSKDPPHIIFFCKTIGGFDHSNN